MMVQVEVGSYSNCGIVRFSTSPRLNWRGSFVLGNSLKRIIVWYKVLHFRSNISRRKGLGSPINGRLYIAEQP